eukprot:TRINITY_DN11230_c0_g1_i1.p1 TRINITY_DN11230_c0_g1~~TRINITY_DN11230_c0_g1_i1.p1  ORF type:complete len:103 (-),score=20.68 TRINITY_DN11230_c0_g1_i1:31-339(-)
MQRGLVGSEMCIRDRSEGMIILIIQNRSENFITWMYIFYFPMYSALIPVSYTHLTLPTILLVQISVVAVSLKKKQLQNQCNGARIQNNRTRTRHHTQMDSRR